MEDGEGDCPLMLVKRLTFPADQKLSGQWGRIFLDHFPNSGYTVSMVLCGGTGVKGGIEAKKEGVDNGGTLFLFLDCYDKGC